MKTLYCLCESFKEAFLRCNASIRELPVVLEENLHPSGVLPVSWMGLVGLVERGEPQPLRSFYNEEAMWPPAALFSSYPTTAYPIWTFRVYVYWVYTRPHLKG